MADALTILGGALVDVLREGLLRFRPHAQVLLERVREVAEPPEGVCLKTEDGSTYTGVLVIDHNEVVMMLAARQEPCVITRAVERPPLITPPSPPPHRPLHQRSLFEEDQGAWDDDGRFGRFR